MADSLNRHLEEKTVPTPGIFFAETLVAGTHPCQGEEEEDELNRHGCVPATRFPASDRPAREKKMRIHSTATGVYQ